MMYKDLRSDLIAEMADESFHSVTGKLNRQGRAGAVCRRTNGHSLSVVDDDAETWNSKRTTTGEPKGGRGSEQSKIDWL